MSEHKIMEQACRECRKPFTPRNHWHVYCSARCRQRGYFSRSFTNQLRRLLIEMEREMERETERELDRETGA